MSDIRANTISDAAGTGPVDLYKQSAAKAWASLNGKNTIAIDSSLNVSSATDLGTGNYRFNFTSAMSVSNYGLVAVSHAGGVAYTSISLSRTTTSWALGSGRTDTFVGIDTDQNQSAVHGDLA